MRYRFDIVLVLSIVCISACADIKPVADTLENNHAEDEAIAKDIRKLAEKGNVIAQNGLGHLYIAGAGVPQNYRHAKKWFEEAAKQGHAEAQVNLGTLYLRGEGAPQSAQMALFWFDRAAEQGDARAFVKLGLMYAEAQGVPQDFVQAYMWLHLAAATGDEYGAEQRDILATKMTSDQITDAQERAHEWKPTNKSIVWKFRTLPDPLVETRRRNASVE